MTLAELIAARDALRARHKAAVEAYNAEHDRLNAAICAAERAEQRASVERRMTTWPPEVIALLRQPHPPMRYSSDWAPLSRRGLVVRSGGYAPGRWTTDAEIAREILEVTP